MKRIFLCVLFMFVWVSIGASQGHSMSKGTVNVRFMSSSLDSLVTQSSRVNYSQTQLDGFRIQVYSGSGVNSKDEAMASQAKFLNLFPRVPVYVVYNAPFWRVRVGDFRTRSEALPILNRVKKHFGGCYVVRDNTIKKKTFY